MSDEALADLLEFVLAPRPERLSDLMYAGMDPATREEAVGAGEAIAALALVEAPVKPPAALRARILETIRAKRAAEPRRAILVCDMINDHLTPGRALEVPRARDIVPALVERLDEARKRGTPVVYVLDRHDADDPELNEWGVHAVEGTEGAEVWPPLAPKPGDKQVLKPSFSGFYQSQLDDVLRELHVDTLVLTGCASEVQLMATATDALQRGYAVELPPGLHAGASPVAEAVTAGVLSALVPYQPARKALLARVAQGA